VEALEWSGASTSTEDTMPNSSQTTTGVVPTLVEVVSKSLQRKRKAPPAVAKPLKPGYRIDAKGRIAAEPIPAEDAPSVSVPNKRATILNMLHRPEGASLAQLVGVTNWQPHSIRGFLSGTVRKKLGHNLISETIEGRRHYRIDGEKV
jgi:hypothetical protein